MNKFQIFVVVDTNKDWFRELQNNIHIKNEKNLVPCHITRLIGLSN